MKALIKYIILLIVLLLTLDVKIPVGNNFNVGIKDFLIVILSFLLVKNFISRKKITNILSQNFYIAAVFLFFFSTALSNIFVGNLINGLQDLLRILEGFVIILGIYFFLLFYPAIFLYRAIIVSGAILSVQIFIEHFFGISTTSKSLGGVSGLWISIGILALYFNYKSINWPVVLKISLFIFFVLANYFSVRRTWIIITVILLAIDYLKNFSRKKLIIGISSVIALFLLQGIVAGAIFQNERTYEVIRSIYNLDLSDISSISSRFFRWKIAVDLIMNNWFFGVGLNNIDLGLEAWLASKNTDNQYMQMWLENGLLALAVFIVILIKGCMVKMGNSINETLFLRNSFILLTIGGLTWSYIIGFGVLMFSIMAGLLSANNNPQFLYPSGTWNIKLWNR